MDEREQLLARHHHEPVVASKVLKLGDLVKSARRGGMQGGFLIHSDAKLSPMGRWELGDGLFEIPSAFVGLIIAFTNDYRASIVLIEEKTYWMATLSIAKVA